MAVEERAIHAPVNTHRFMYVFRLTWIVPTSKIHRKWASLTKHRPASDQTQLSQEFSGRRPSEDFLIVDHPTIAEPDNGGHRLSGDSRPSTIATPEQQLTFSKDTQIALTAADIWRLQQQAESSRPAFPPPPPPPLTPSAPPPCERCRKHSQVQQELARLRKELLTLRARVQNELRVLAQMQEFALKAQESVIEAVNKAIDRRTLAEDQAEIQTLQQEVLHLNRDLHDQSEHHKALQRRLSTLDYQFGEKEEELYGKVDRVGSAADYDEHNDTASSLVTDSTEDDAPTLVRAYYDCIGTMDTAWHTLQEIEEDHREELNRREQNVSESHSLVPSEKQFVREFFEDRAKVVERYLRTEVKAKKLREQCLERKYRIHDNEILDPPPLGTYATVKPLELLLFRPSDPQEHLVSWLEEVLREQAAATYRFPLSTNQHSVPEIGQAAHPELKRYVSKVPTPHLGAHGGFPESSRGLSSSPMYTPWPSEKFLRRRYSYPDLSSKQRLAAPERPNTASRSTC
jgi:hypothetical protein